MDVPLELARLGLTAPEERAVDSVVTRSMAKLNRRHPDLVSCQISVERPQVSQTGNPYRVRIRATTRGHVETVVVKGPLDNDRHLDIGAVIRGAFEALERQLLKEQHKLRGRVKSHAPEAVFEDIGAGLVVRLNRQSDFGFLRTDDGREIYFHANAIVNASLDELEVGSSVRFEAEEGEDGPQATTVRVVQHAPRKQGPQDVEDPQGWRRQTVDDEP